MKAKDVRELGVDELKVKEREITEELCHLRLRRATSQLANPMKLQTTKRDLARVKTALRARALAEGSR